MRFSLFVQFLPHSATRYSRHIHILPVSSTPTPYSLIWSHERHCHVAPRSKQLRRILRPWYNYSTEYICFPNSVRQSTPFITPTYYFFSPQCCRKCLMLPKTHLKVLCGVWLANNTSQSTISISKTSNGYFSSADRWWRMPWRRKEEVQLP